jgi:excisionase family DNA binding protein
MSESTLEMLTPKQAAAYLQVSRASIYRRIQRGTLAAIRLGRAYRIPWSSLEPFLASTRPDITIRAYSDEQLAAFLEANLLDDKARSVMARSRPNATAPGD